MNELYNYFWDGGIYLSIFDFFYMFVIDVRFWVDYDCGYIILVWCVLLLFIELVFLMFGYSLFGVGGLEVVVNCFSEFIYVVVYGNVVLDFRNIDLLEIKFLRELMNYELVDLLFLILGYDSFL